MPTTPTYSPVPHAPATAGTQSAPAWRYAQYAEPHPVQPLKGLPGTRATDVSYRALAPGGAGFCYRICTGTSESRPTAHYSLLTANSTYTFSAKEKDSETGLSYFGSRYYSSDLSIWLSVDPMSGKYPSLSPYTYCADNPVMLTDPNGDTVRPMGIEEYELILNTLPQNDRRYVQLDKNGFIDKDLMNSHQSESSNYNGLCDLVNDDIIYEVILEGTAFPCIDKNGNAIAQEASYKELWQYSMFDKEGNTTNKFTTGEEGNSGLTLFPGRDCPLNSTDNNVKIYINKMFSIAGRAESFSHEGFGHALLYCLNGHNAYAAGHYYGTVGIDNNIQLVNMIISAKKETIKNMHQ